MIITTIEFLDYGQMRWNVSFWNRSSTEWRLGFDYARISVTDVDRGIVYPLIESDAGNGALIAFQRKDFEFYFSIPEEKVNAFNFRHVGEVSGWSSYSSQFDDVIIRLDLSATCH